MTSASAVARAILLSLLALPALAADCPDKQKLVAAARKRFNAIQQIPFAQPDAKEYLCAGQHVTVYVREGKRVKLIAESEGDAVYRKEFYFDGGKLFFVFDKRFERSPEDSPVVESRVYLGPKCILERVRQKKPRGVGNAVEDFDLSDLRDQERVLPAGGAAAYEKEAAAFEKKTGEACSPEDAP